MSEHTKMTNSEEDAFALTRSAVALSQAIENKDQAALAKALDDNLNLWTGIKTLVCREECALPNDIRENLKRLCDFTAKATFDMSKDYTPDKVETLINLNLQIAEGLLEGAEKK